MSGQKMYKLSKEEISDLVSACTRAGVDAYRKQQDSDKKRRELLTDPAKRMKEQLSGYRRVKRTLREEQQYTPQEQYEYRLAFIEDLMGDPARDGRTERLLQSREEKRRMDFYTISQIDEALNLYGMEIDEDGNEEGARRYRIMRAYYIDGEQQPKIDAIAQQENVSTATVYRDLEAACRIMYQYAVGM